MSILTAVLKYLTIQHIDTCINNSDKNKQTNKQTNKTVCGI